VPVLTRRKEDVNPGPKQTTPLPCGGALVPSNEDGADEEATKETVMRLVTSLFAVLLLSSLAGCATVSTNASRRDDTAVRAEARRISNTGPLLERGSDQSSPSHDVAF
jgi:hypothetical protein